MSPLTIAWRNLRTRPVPTALTTTIIALALGVAVAVIVLGAGIRRGLTTASGPFELVIGPKGSPTQLVVSSILYQDVPIGNMTYAQYQALAADPRVHDAVPLALGDNLHGLRLVGTTPTMFQIAITPERPPFYRVAQGRAFAQDFEAVLGSAAARQLDFSLGATFTSMHGVQHSVNGTQHQGFAYTVVGVLAPTDTPADLGIYVPLSSYWKVHGVMQGSIFSPSVTPRENGQADADGDSATGVTAVLVRARDISAAYQIYQQLNAGKELQAALPGAVLIQLLNLLGQGQQLLSFVTGIALGMAVLSMTLALYGAVLNRQREIAVLRALGAGRRTVLGVALCEALLQGTVGLLAGVALGHGVAAAAAGFVNQQSALAVGTRFELVPEVGLLLSMLGLGVLAGILPALRAYRVEAAHVLART